MRKLRRYLLITILVLAAVYLLGPKPSEPEFDMNLPSLTSNFRNLEKMIKENEKMHNIKPDNESRIIWANDSSVERTEYSLLYLHGFSASWYEGYPVNKNFAQYFGMNAYFPRLASHGIDTVDALTDMTPDRLWTSAKESLMIARKIGKRVLIMGTSTGGTLALMLAATFPEYVDGLILYSPNIRINNNKSFLLSKPWGLQIARKSYNGRYRVTNQDSTSKECAYWNCKYRLEAIVYLQQLIDFTMKKETYARVTAPVFLGYYYKDKDNQDDVVKVKSMLKMFDQLGTEEGRKIKVPFPDAGSHTICSELFSGVVDDLLIETINFGKDVLNLKPVKAKK
ncbi:MAG: alpha/beta hydrolase [Bacteroidales bacterium]|jgi:esterase/lipase|nr:alpha/beta hydrolase [Bacteroidales bacterium]